MKRSLRLGSLVLTFAFVVSALAVGVYSALVEREAELNGNLHFDASQVKATITVYEAFAQSQMEIETGTATYTQKGVLEFEEEDQTAKSLSLGNQGRIDFAPEACVYSVKIVVENKFKAGGRSVGVQCFYEYHNSNGLEMFESFTLLSTGQEPTIQNGKDVVPAQDTYTITLSYVLDTEVASPFGTDEEPALPLGLVMQLFRL